MRLCAWDLDGTLVDTVDDICLHVNRTLGSLGLPGREVAEVRPHIGRGAKELLRGVLREEQLEEAVRIFRASYLDEPVVHSRLFPGALACLERLRAAGIASAVVTNKPRDVSVKLLEQLGALPHLAVVEGAVEGIPHKPDPALLQRAAGRVAARTVVMVGDSRVDVDTARAFGCAFVGVEHGMDGGAAIRALGLRAHGSLEEATDEVLRVMGSA